MTKRAPAEIASPAYGVDRRLVLVAGASAAAVGAGRPVTAEEVSTDSYDAALARAFESKKPAALAGAVWREGRMLWSGATGLRRVGTEDAVTVQDRWHLGSNTKAMTAALWAKQVERGTVVWDMPLEAAVQAAYPGMPVHEGWADRTVDDFMRHRAGLYDATYVTPLWLMASRIKTDPLTDQRRAMVATMLAAAPNGPRGTFQYGNANYILVGALLEGLTGKAWEALMQEALFAPLGIATGGFGAPLADQPWGHSTNAAGPVAIDPGLPASDNPKVLGPAGTAHMSLADYGLFLNAMMQPGWLAAESLERLRTPLAGEHYAMGWIVVGGQSWAKGPVLAHDGSNTLWYASAAMDTGARLAMLAVSNDGTKGAEACPGLISALVGASLR